MHAVAASLRNPIFQFATRRAAVEHQTELKSKPVHVFLFKARLGEKKKKRERKKKGSFIIMQDMIFFKIVFFKTEISL